ncbi:hypothetical protein K439DRAFT_1615695 [Ramaria rubella]|nr:hypothetical protein K439DRAFT_1615695 [Ramaria rubella]
MGPKSVMSLLYSKPGVLFNLHALVRLGNITLHAPLREQTTFAAMLGLASAGMGTHMYIHNDSEGFLDNLRLSRQTFSTLSDEDIFPGLQFDLHLSGVTVQLLPPAGLPATAALPPAGLPTAAAPPPTLTPQPLTALFPPFPILPPPAK